MAKKKKTPPVEKAKPKRVKQVGKSGEYTCSECSKNFDYEMPDDEYRKVTTLKAGSMPFRVLCPHCKDHPQIHGEGSKAAKTIKRKDWPSGKEKPWE